MIFFALKVIRGRMKENVLYLSIIVLCIYIYLARTRPLGVCTAATMAKATRAEIGPLKSTMKVSLVVYTGMNYFKKKMMGG